jgi:hypothetical protein
MESGRAVKKIAGYQRRDGRWLDPIRGRRDRLDNAAPSA